MNEGVSPTSAGDDCGELRAQVTSLRAVVVKLQVATIAIVWIMGIFLVIQLSRAIKDVNSSLPQITQLLAASKREDADVARFAGKLASFAKTNPDIIPLLARHGFPVAAAPAAPPKTATPPAPKK